MPDIPETVTSGDRIQTSWWNEIRALLNNVFGNITRSGQLIYSDGLRSFAVLDRPSQNSRLQYDSDTDTISWTDTTLSANKRVYINPSTVGPADSRAVYIRNDVINPETPAAFSENFPASIGTGSTGAVYVPANTNPRPTASRLKVLDIAGNVVVGTTPSLYIHITPAPVVNSFRGFAYTGSKYITTFQSSVSTFTLAVLSDTLTPERRFNLTDISSPYNIKGLAFFNNKAYVLNADTNSTAINVKRYPVDGTNNRASDASYNIPRITYADRLVRTGHQQPVASYEPQAIYADAKGLYILWKPTIGDLVPLIGMYTHTGIPITFFACLGTQHGANGPKVLFGGDNNLLVFNDHAGTNLRSIDISIPDANNYVDTDGTTAVYPFFGSVWKSNGTKWVKQGYLSI